MSTKVDNIGQKSRRIYVGHLPFGFYSKALKEYFSQFGKVNKVRVDRSEKTGGYKGYAFVEFESPEVAKIAAEATDNYIIGSKMIKAKYIPNEDIHTANLKVKKSFATHPIPEEVKHSNMFTAVGLSTRVLIRHLYQYVQLCDKLAEYGVVYDEVPLDLELYEERVKESFGRKERVLEFKKNEAKLRVEARATRKRFKKFVKKKARGKKPTNKPEEEEEGSQFKSAHVIDSFEKALDALKGQSSSNSSDLNRSGEKQTAVEHIQLVQPNSRKRKRQKQPKNEEEVTSDTKSGQSPEKKKKNDSTVSVDSLSNEKESGAAVSKKKKKKNKEQQANISKVASSTISNGSSNSAENTDGKSSEKKKKKKDKKKQKSLEVGEISVTEANDASKVGGSNLTTGKKKKNKKPGFQNGDKSGEKTQMVISSTLPSSEIVDSGVFSARKKQFAKEEVVSSFKHKVKNIQFKYMS